MRILSVITGAALVLGLSATAQAKDMEGKWGFGGSTQTSVVGGVPTNTIDGIYWLGDIGLEGRLGFALASNGGTNVGFVGGMSLIYNFVDFETVNVGIGVDVDGQISAPEGQDAAVGINLGVPLRGEYFFSDNFALNGSVGLGVGIDTDASRVSFGIGNAGVFGQFGFIWYMN